MVNQREEKNASERVEQRGKVKSRAAVGRDHALPLKGSALAIFRHFVTSFLVTTWALGKVQKQTFILIFCLIFWDRSRPIPSITRERPALWEASFTISDSAYGSTIFMATRFHGIHVIIGTTFLLVCLTRHFKNHFSNGHHFGFEAAAWYWHFVAVVWLFLYIRIYWWRG